MFCPVLRARQPGHFFTRSMASSKKNSVEYCVDLVKRRDYEHFLTNLLLPKSARQTAFAIRAFNVEIASVRDSISEKTLGMMRMQFWKDALDSIFGSSIKGIPEQPVTIELAKAVRKHSLSREHFDRIIQARESRLSDKPFESLDDLDSYSERAFSSVNHLIFESLGKPVSKHAHHCAVHLGQAEGAVTLLRALAFNASRRRITLPSDLMANFKLSAESIIRKKKEPEVEEDLKKVVEIIASRAQEHIENCRFRKKKLSREEKLVMLPAVSVDGFLGILHKCQCNPFDSKLHSRNSWLPMSLYWHKWKNSF